MGGKREYFAKAFAIPLRTKKTARLADREQSSQVLISKVESSSSTLEPEEGTKEKIAPKYDCILVSPILGQQF